MTRVDLLVDAAIPFLIPLGPIWICYVIFRLVNGGAPMGHRQRFVTAAWAFFFFEFGILGALGSLWNIQFRISISLVLCTLLALVVGRWWAGRGQARNDLGG